MNRYLLELQEPDGQVMAEALYFYANGAGPVDDNGLPLSYGRAVSSSAASGESRGRNLPKDSYGSPARP